MSEQTPEQTISAWLRRANLRERTDTLPFRIPGTSQSAAVKCYILPEEEMLQLLAAAPAPATAIAPASQAADVGPKERVRGQYPRAYCSGGNGGEFPWLIYATISELSEDNVIGRGRSGTAAWSDASRQLQEGPAS